MRDISKSEVNDLSSKAKIEKIDQVIRSLEVSMDDTIYNQRIQNLNGRIKDVSYQVAERTLILERQITKLEKQKKAINVAHIASKIEQLKVSKIALIKDLNSAKSGFDLMSDALNIRTTLLMTILLLLFAIVLELIVYSASTGVFNVHVVGKGRQTTSRALKTSKKQGKERLSIY
jgi:hypothetical protein